MAHPTPDLRSSAGPLSTRRGRTRQLATSRLIAAQLGVVGRKQLFELGWSRHAIDRAVRDGRLSVVRPSVYAPGGSTPLPGSRLLQATLTAPREAVISHGLALEAVGATKVDPVRLLEFTVTSGHPRPSHGVLPHRTRWLPPDDVTTVDGHPVTIFARSLYDVAGRSTPRQLDRLLDEAARIGLIDWRQLYRVIDERKRVAGRRKLTDAISRLGASMGRARSEFERLAVRVCIEQGLPEPVLNGVVAGVEVDLHQPWSRGIVELDGFRFHSSPADVTRNAERRAAVRGAGHPLLTVSWFQVSQRGRDTATQMAAFWERHRKA